MPDFIEQYIQNCTGATSVVLSEPIQTLWSGYGQIVRAYPQYSVGESCGPEQHQSVIVKHIDPPSPGERHPRGWNTKASHVRKLESYRVETHWYQQWAPLCDDTCRVPLCLGAVQTPGENSQGCVLVLQDLDREFPRRCSQLDLDQIQPCLMWLANFHALFMSVGSHSLWASGTYWHLATRQGEHAVMEQGALKDAAEQLDKRLASARWQTLVHGDAKLANFCFSNDMKTVAAVDFQYVGGGCGMKDLIYFLGSALPGETIRQHEIDLLEIYFKALGDALARHHPSLAADAVIDEWRSLYAIAWTDFSRFLTGWMPEHSKLDHYSAELAERALAQLRGPR